MPGPYVTIIIPPHAPGMEPQTLTVDITGPERAFIIGDGKVAFGFSDTEGFGSSQGQGSEVLKDSLNEAIGKIRDLGVGGGNKAGSTPSAPAAPATPAPAGNPAPDNPAPTPLSEADIQALVEMGFTDEQIRDYQQKQAEDVGQAQGTSTPAVSPAVGGVQPPTVDPANPMPGVPTPDLKDMHTTEERVGYLEALEDKEDLGNKKLAFGLFRNAKDEGRQDLVDRICSWLDLPEFIVETQAPKSV